MKSRATNCNLLWELCCWTCFPPLLKTLAHILDKCSHVITLLPFAWRKETTSQPSSHVCFLVDAMNMPRKIEWAGLEGNGWSTCDKRSFIFELGYAAAKEKEHDDRLVGMSTVRIGRAIDRTYILNITRRWQVTIVNPQSSNRLQARQVEICAVGQVHFSGIQKKLVNQYRVGAAATHWETLLGGSLSTYGLMIRCIARPIFWLT